MAPNPAFDDSAPPDERRDALTELQREHLPGASELLDQGLIRDLVGQVQDRFAEVAFEQQLSKAIDSNVVPFPSMRSREGRPGMQSVTVDELQVAVLGEYWERPGQIAFDALRLMVQETPVLNAVVMTRVRQVQRFCRIAESGELPGFEIRHVDREHQLTPGEKETKQQLQRFIANCGWEFSPRRRKAMRRDSFKAFMAKAVRDSLTMDSIGLELEWKRDRGRGLDGFYAVDGATIRLCSEQGYQGNDEIFALQVVGGRVCTAYTFEDLIYEPRNPRTDVLSLGYGVSEVELLVRVVTGFLNAMSYNSRGFDENAIPKGMLHLSGNYTQGDIAAFKRMWNAMVRGVNNQWSLPVMVSKDQESKASFEKFGIDFNEMHFSKWMTFLTSIICAIYGMSPAEINFDSFTAGSTSALAGSDTGEKLAASKDSGLYPLLSHFGDLLSDNIVAEFGPEWCFRWTGLEPDDADKRHELKKLVSTVDELRAEQGMVAHPDPKQGGAPANPALMQVYMAGLQPPQGADFGGGAPGAPGQGGDAAPTAPGADFGGSPGEQGDFGDEGDEGFGLQKKGDFGDAAAAPGGGDFGGERGEDFGKAMPSVYEVTL